MFIDQLVCLSPEDDTKIIEAKNDSFHFTAGGQLDHHMVSVPPDTIKKLILNINLILIHHALPPSLPQKDLTSRKMFCRSVDSSHQ
jgi:hypothetical protein